MRRSRREYRKRRMIPRFLALVTGRMVFLLWHWRTWEEELVSKGRRSVCLWTPDFKVLQDVTEWQGVAWQAVWSRDQKFRERSGQERER